MRRLLTAFVMVCASFLALVPVPAQALQDPIAPGFDEGFGPPGDPGVPSGFVAFFIFAILLGVGTTIWRVSLARQVARVRGWTRTRPPP